MKKLAIAFLAAGSVLATGASSAWATPFTVTAPGFSFTGDVEGAVDSNPCGSSTIHPAGDCTLYHLMGASTGNISITFIPVDSAFDTTNADFIVEHVSAYTDDTLPTNIEDALNEGYSNDFYTGTGSFPVDTSGILLMLTSGTDNGDYVLLDRETGPSIDVVLLNPNLANPNTEVAGTNFSSPSATLGSNDITNATPEPSSLVLLGSGLLGAAFLLFRRNRAATSSRPTA
jgi:hypothetical protein